MVNYQDEAHTSIETITTAAQATARALHASAIANATAEWKESPTADDHASTYVGRKKIAELEEVKVGLTQLSQFCKSKCVLHSISF